MKPSRYNFFIQLEGGRQLSFNGLSTNLSEIYPEKASFVAGLLDGSLKPTTEEEKEIYQALVEGKYLVDDGLDEQEFLKVRNRQSRFEKSAFFLTIAPTLGCNFNCDYCFEKQSPEKMTVETEQAIIKFSEKYMKKADISGLVWFGGEPTLCVPTIERLQNGMKELAEKYGVSFEPGSIITNGFLLDGKLAERLNKVGVTSAQVTIDGPRETHDKRRKLHNGMGTYDRIISNLAESSKIIKIVVRVNVDKQNAGDAFRVVEELEEKGILNNVNLAFAQVHSSEGVCPDVEKHCLTTQEFSLFLVKLYHALIAKGFYRIEYPGLAPGGHCGADTDGSLVITPSGNIFKCWEDITRPEWSVGNIYSEEVSPQQEANYLKYMGWDPFEREECLSCSILPICMGGCPRQSLEKELRIGKCCSWKYNLEEMLVMQYECDLRKEVK
jgi:uncharacterized protein